MPEVVTGGHHTRDRCLHRCLSVAHWVRAESCSSDPAVDSPLTAEALAALQGVGPVSSVDELQADLWEDDAEVDAFIEDVCRANVA